MNPEKPQNNQVKPDQLIQPSQPTPLPAQSQTFQPTQSVQPTIQHPFSPLPAQPTRTSLVTPTPAKSKLPLIITVAVIALLLVVGGLVALASTKDKKPVADNSTSPSQDSSVAAPVDTPAAEVATIKLVDKTITDPEMGYTITAKSMTINALNIPEKYAENNKDNVVVTVEFVNTDDGKFAGTAKNVILNLIDSKGERYPATSLSDLDLKAKKLTPLADASEIDNVVTGHLVYWIPAASVDKLTLRYKRLAVKVINSEQTIPAKEFDLQLR